MGSTVIDGTIDDLVTRRPASSRRGALYDRIDIIDQHGVTIVLRGVRAEPEVARRIGVGTAGRFYVHAVAGVRGVHGFRPVRGAPVFAFPRLPALACLLIALANLTWIAWRAHTGAAQPMFVIAPFMLACMCYAALRRTEAEARRMVASDIAPVIIPGQPRPDG